MTRVLYETGFDKYVTIGADDGEVHFTSDAEKAWSPPNGKEYSLSEIKQVFDLQWLSTLEWRDL